MRQPSIGISERRIAHRGPMRWIATLVVAAVAIAALAILLPGIRSHDPADKSASNDRKSEPTPITPSAPAPSELDPAATDASHAYDDLLAQGDAFALQGDQATAIGAYTKAIDVEPRRTEGFAQRAAAQANAGAWDMAIADYNRAIQRSPSDAELFLGRARVQVSRGRTDLALDDCDKALRLSPKLTKARLYRANVYLGRREFDAAIDDYDAILKAVPASASAYCNRGVAYRSKGNLKRTIADYTSAIRYNAQFAEAYNNRGEIYLQQKKYDRAMADFNECLRIDPAESDSYDNRGDLYLLLGKPEPAIADYTEIIDRARRLAAKTHLHPSERLANVYLKRASARLKIDQAQEAVADVGEAVEIYPENARAYIIRRDAYLKLGKPELARDDDDLAKRLNRSKPREEPTP